MIGLARCYSGGGLYALRRWSDQRRTRRLAWVAPSTSS